MLKNFWLSFFVLLGCLLVCNRSAWAATYDYIGGLLSHNWSNPDHWNQGVLPGPNDTADFGGTVGDLTATLTQSVQVGAIFFDPANALSYVINSTSVSNLLNVSNNSGVGLITVGQTANFIQTSLSISNSLAINFSNPVDLTISGAISGGSTEPLTQTGGTLVLSGNNSYRGGTTVTSGSLGISADDNLGASSGVLTLSGSSLSAQGPFALVSGRSVSLIGSSFVNTNGNACSIAGVIGGSGSLTKQGAQTLTLSGANGYMGGTTISQGTLALSLGGSLFSTGAVTVNGTSIFDISGLTGSGTTIGDLTTVAGTTVALGAKALTFGTGNSTTIAGVISGTGGSIIKQGSGTVTLTGANTNSGGTTVSAGTMAISLGGSLLSTGALTVNGTSIFDISALTAGGITIGPLTTTSLSTVSLGTKVLTFGGTEVTTIAGSITGTGSIIKQGSGVAELSNTNTATNTYSGGTTVAATALAISADANLGAVSGALTLNAGTTLLAYGSFSLLSGRSVVLAGNATVDSNENNPSIAGVISGAFSLTKESSGTLTLSGTNTYGTALNGTIITGGILSVSADNNLGNALAPVTIGSATLQLSSSIPSARNITLSGAAIIDTKGSSNSSSLSGTISGSGFLTKQGSGILTLSGANTYGSASNGTVISKGVLSISADNNLGDTVDPSPLSIGSATLQITAPMTSNRVITFTGSSIVDTQGNTVSLLGGTSLCNGSLTKQGTGTLILGGTSQYTGGTTVSAGILQGTTSSLQGSISTSVGTTVVFDQTSNTPSYGSVISGFGSVTKRGSGTVILTGANSYSGGTTIANGTLQGTTVSLQGGINLSSVNGTLSFNQSTSGTYAGSITGVAGSSLTILGAGIVTMTGNSSSFLGSTSLTSGNLVMNGSLAASPLTVSLGSTLSGTGTVGPTTNNGQISPGSSNAGTLTVNGNATFNAGSLLVSSLTPTTNSLLHVTGTATIGSGGLRLNIGPGFYGVGNAYTLLTAGLVSGQFSSVSLSSPNFIYGLTYLPGSVVLDLISLDPFFDFPFANANERSVGNNIDQLSEQRILNPDMSSAIDSLAGQSVETINDALDQMHPAALSAFAELQAELGGQLLSIFHRKPNLSCFCTNSNRLWVEPFGNWLKEKQQGMEIGFDATTRGVAFGLDHQFFNCWTIGVGGAWNATDLTWFLDRGHAYIDGLYGSLYTDVLIDHFYLGASAYAGKDWYSTSRRLRFTVIDRQATSHSHGLDAGGQFTAAYFFGMPSCLLYPYATVDYLYLRNSAFSESGAISFDLSVDEYRSSTLRAEAGGAWEFTDRNRDGTMCISPMVSIGYVLEKPLHRSSYRSTFAGQSIPFTTWGWDMAWQLLNLRFGLKLTYRCLVIDAQYIADIATDGDTPLFNQRANFRFGYNF